MKNLNKGNYAINNRNLQLLISEEYAEKIVPSDDSVRLLDEIVEEMKLKPLERAYKRTGRNYGTSLRTMLKIIK